jgi:hypothetical protein
MKLHGLKTLVSVERSRLHSIPALKYRVLSETQPIVLVEIQYNGLGK